MWIFKEYPAISEIMKKKNKAVITLLFLAPFIAECLSGSAPPIVFFNPLGFIILVLLYGCGCLLIRELKVRWNLGMGVIFLGIAYSILEEGVMMQSFFNIYHGDLGILSNYGTWLQVQWPWTIQLIFYHTVVSICVPISLINMLWPELKQQPLLKKRGVIANFTGLIFAVSFWMIVAIEKKNIDTYLDYNPDYFIIMLSMIAIFLFVLLSFKVGKMISIKDQPVRSCFRLWLYGVVFIFFVLVFPYVMAAVNVNALVPVIMMLFLGYKSFRFAINNIYNINFTEKHEYFLSLGLVSPLIVFSFFHELGIIKNNDPTKGMAIIGLLTIIFFIYLGVNVFRRERYSKKRGNHV